MNEPANIEIAVQLDGKFVKNIQVAADASRTTIETAARKAAGMVNYQSVVTIVPGRSANVQSMAMSA